MRYQTMAIWMKVTKDEYELPIAVADSAGELARMLNVTANSIMSGVSHMKHDGIWTAYRKVEEDEQDE